MFHHIRRAQQHSGMRVSGGLWGLLPDLSCTSCHCPGPTSAPLTFPVSLSAPLSGAASTGLLEMVFHTAILMCLLYRTVSSLRAGV